MARLKRPRRSAPVNLVASPSRPAKRKRKIVEHRVARSPSPEIVNLLDSSDDEPEAANLEFTYESDDGIDIDHVFDSGKANELNDGMEDDLESVAEVNENAGNLNDATSEPGANGVEDNLESIEEPDDNLKSTDEPEPAPQYEPGDTNGHAEDLYEPAQADTPSPKPDSDAGYAPLSPAADADSDGDRNVKPLRPREDLEPATLKPQCLPPVETQIDNHWVYLFFRFCHERHAMYDRREVGAPRDQLTKDKTMTIIHIGNVYRQLDPSSGKMRTNIIDIGDQSAEEVCFRVFLFCMFYKEPTWEALCAAAGGIPSWKNYEADLPAMEAALHQMSIVEGQRLYYGGFQLVPPNVYFSENRNRDKTIVHYASSLRLVLAMMKAGIPARLAECTYAVDASYVLGTVPTLGGFLGLNILCFLNDTSNFTWLYRDFATCGPGSRKYLQRMFGKQCINSTAMEEAGLRWLCDNQWRYWARLGLDPPHPWQSGLRPGMRVLDIENALCWAHRYVNAYLDKGTRSLADLPPPSYDPEVTERCGPPAWCVEQRWLGSTSRTSWDADHSEVDDRVESLGDDVYEIEKVVARLGSLDDKDGRFRVRWTGWTPEHDTWERASSLREDAEESLEHWIELERRVSWSIADIKKNKPFVWPKGHKPGQGIVRPSRLAEVYAPKAEPDVAAQADARGVRAAKRLRREGVKDE